MQAFAQQRALLGTGQRGFDRGLDAVKLSAGAGLFQEVDLLFGEVQRRLDQHAQLDGARGQLVDLLRELARQRARGAARGGFGAGLDQVGHGLGLGKVDLVVEKGALGELARPRQPQARLRLQAARQQQLQQHRAAVGLQLEHVFAGVAVRGRKVDRQATV